MTRVRGNVSQETGKMLRERLASQDWRSLVNTWERADEARCFTAAVLNFADLAEPGTVALLKPAVLADRSLMPDFARRWAASDEGAALAWLDTLPHGTIERGEPAMAMAQVIASRDPARAAEIIRDLPLSERYEHAIAEVWTADGMARRLPERKPTLRSGVRQAVHGIPNRTARPRLSRLQIPGGRAAALVVPASRRAECHPHGPGRASDVPS